MNDLVLYKPNTSVSTFLTGHPLDVLWSVNPEIAGLAYANRAELFSPEIIPLINNFRECQSQEKITSLNAIVDKLAIDADERKNQVIAKTRERLAELEQASIIGQTSIMANAQIRTQELKSNTSLDIQKLKYELNHYAIEQQAQGQKYISDNELRALQIETTALYNFLEFHERNQNSLRAKELDERTKEAAITAEKQYLTKIKEAEIQRAGSELHDRAEVINAYLRSQAIMNHSALEYEIAITEANSATEISCNKTLAEITKEALRRGAKKIRFYGQTRFGEISIDMEVDDDGKQS